MANKLQINAKDTDINMFNNYQWRYNKGILEYIDTDNRLSVWKKAPEKIKNLISDKTVGK